MQSDNSDEFITTLPLAAGHFTQPVLYKYRRSHPNYDLFYPTQTLIFFQFDILIYFIHNGSFWSPRGCAYHSIVPSQTGWELFRETLDTGKTEKFYTGDKAKYFEIKFMATREAKSPTTKPTMAIDFIRILPGECS